MEKILGRYERGALWILVALLFIATALLYNSLNGLRSDMNKLASAVEEPQVHATLLPAIPDALAGAWTKASAQEKGKTPSRDDYLWFTVRFTNTGAEPARVTAATLTVLPEIGAVYAYTADDKTFETAWKGPEITAGGRGKHFVTVSLPTIEPGRTDLLFVGVKPEGRQGPYAETDHSWWAERYPMYWRKITVTSAKRDWTGDKRTEVGYGLAPEGKAQRSS